MNKHERRELWLREQSDIATAKAKAKADREAAFSHHSLFDSLPMSLDDLLRESFAERVWRPRIVEPSQFGYPHLIDGRPVADTEHDIVCRTLFAQLKAIVEWCRDRQIDLLSLVNAEIESLAELYRQRWVTPPDTDPYRNPKRLLDILEDLIDGDENEAFTDLMQLGKTVPVNYTMSKLRVAIDDQLRAKRSCVSRNHETTTSDSHLSAINPTTKEALQDITPQIDDQLPEEQSCASRTHETTSSDSSHSASDSTAKEALQDTTPMTDYRTPTEWRKLREEAGLSSSERTWTKIRKNNAAEIHCESGNRGGPVRLTRRLAENWGLNLPEFKQKSAP